MSWDYIVVGAGSAGCAAVHNLVQTDKRVLLIEAGGSADHSLVRYPFFVLQALDRFDWGYSCAPDGSRGSRSERWHRGKVLGGTSSVNGMIYVRGSRADYDYWAKTADDSWSSVAVASLFREMECSDPRSITSPPSERGFSGPLHVRSVRSAHRTTKAFVQAMVTMGYPYLDDYNAAVQEGVGFTQLTQFRGKRFSSFDAFVRPHLHATNLEIMKDCLVRDIIIRDGVAKGVTVETGGEIRRLFGDRIVVAAGTINSPKLLMLSGIGDGATLCRLGIPIHRNVPAVGRGLMDHPLVRITYTTKVPTYAVGRNPFAAAKQVMKYLALGQGLLASAHEATAFVRTDEEANEPDIQLHFAPIGVSIPHGRSAAQLMTKPSVFISVKKNYPDSKGSITLRSNDPAEAPLIDANLLGAHTDVDAIARGIALVRRIMASDPMGTMGAHELSESAIYKSEDARRQFVREQASIACHPVGTCRMGRDADAVVDPQLRVRGVKNLWIADASIMPRNVSGNTNAASMMIGYKLGKELAAIDRHRPFSTRPPGT